MAETRLLVVLDDSAASKRAVKYVGKFVGKRREFRIYLMSVLPPMPPELLEHGGSENPAKEASLDAELKTEQHRWISTAKKGSEKALNGARAILRTAGISPAATQAISVEPGENQDSADVILDAARKYKCPTVVVGRQSEEWFQKLFREPLADELSRRGKDFCIWAID